jgi:hypothetical protein
MIYRPYGYQKRLEDTEEKSLRLRASVMEIIEKVPLLRDRIIGIA